MKKILLALLTLPSLTLAGGTDVGSGNFGTSLAKKTALFSQIKILDFDGSVACQETVRTNAAESIQASCDKHGGITTEVFWLGNPQLVRIDGKAYVTGEAQLSLKVVDQDLRGTISFDVEKQTQTLDIKIPGTLRPIKVIVSLVAIQE